MSSSSFSKCPKSRNLKLCAHDAGGWANSGRTRRSSSSGSAPSRWRCVSVFGSDWAKLRESEEAILLTTDYTDFTETYAAAILGRAKDDRTEVLDWTSV